MARRRHLAVPLEKDTNWEGAFRVPCVVRWPGVIKPGTIFNGLFSAEDWLPTLVAAAGGDADIKDKLLKGYQAGGKTFKVHLDGYNQLPVSQGRGERSRRARSSSTSTTTATWSPIRDERFKYAFAVQYAKAWTIWRKPLTTLRAPILIDLLADPFEYAVRHAPALGEVDDRPRLPHPAGGREGRRSTWRPTRTSRRASGRRASPSTR